MVISWWVTLSWCWGWFLRYSYHFLYGDIGLFRLICKLPKSCCLPTSSFSLRPYLNLTWTPMDWPEPKMCPAGIEECITWRHTRLPMYQNGDIQKEGSRFWGPNAHSNDLNIKWFLWALGNFPLRPGHHLIDPPVGGKHLSVLCHPCAIIISIF